MDDFDDFDNGDFMDDDSFEDGFDDDFGSEDSLDDDSGIENEPTGDDICDDEFTVEDAVMSGIAFGWGYEEGLGEKERRRIEREMNKEKDTDKLQSIKVNS